MPAAYLKPHSFPKALPKWQLSRGASNQPPPSTPSANLGSLPSALSQRFKSTSATMWQVHVGLQPHKYDPHPWSLPSRSPWVPGQKMQLSSGAWRKGHQTQAWGSRKVSHCWMTQQGLETSRRELVSERAPPHVQTREITVFLLAGFSVTMSSQTCHPFRAVSSNRLINYSLVLCSPSSGPSAWL